MQVSGKHHVETCGLILLAAGASKRLGQPKQLLQLDGKTFIKNILEIALQVVQSPIIVLGANASVIESEIRNMPVQLIYNADWNEGMASSIRAGIIALIENKPSIENVILMVCDQPFVTAEILNELIVKHHITNKGIIACSYENTIGTPVLFNKKYFDALKLLEGNGGAKKLVLLHAEDVATVNFPLGQVDIDTKKDYRSLLKKYNG